MSPPLLLLDGHSLAYRAFFALPTTIVTSTGQITNAVYGFTSMLIKLLTEQQTDRVGVAFDVGRPTVRLAEYSEYKAGRRETPDEFRGQLDLLREVLAALAIPTFEYPEHEADDVLATIARASAAAGHEVILVTADRDFLQLVDDDVRVLFNRKGVSDYVLYDRAAVEERFGVPPEKLVDLVALKGDTSDNLPGVPGVGDKTASQLIQTFGSVEALYEGLDDLPKRIVRLRPALEESHEQVLRNKRLATLVDDLPVDFEPGSIRMGEWDDDEIRRVFGALQFRSLLERLPDVRAAPEPQAPADVVVRAGALPAGAGSVALAAAPGSDGIALATDGGSGHWIADAAEVADMLADPGVRKIVHDAKSLSVALARRGLPFEGLAFDTEVAAYLLDPATGSYPLEDVSARYLRRDLPRAVAEEGGQGTLELGFDDEGAAAAACSRAAALLPLAEALGDRLEQTGMDALFRDVEMPLIGVLARMEEVGVAIDAELLRRRSAELGKRVAELESEIYDAAGGPFNLNSTPQLRAVLYERIGLKPTRKTGKGEYSTDAQALEALRGQHPIVEAMLEYRELSKLRSTYLDALPPLLDPRDGRVHTRFVQTAAATGRISSESPNLMNIPVRTELGREIRRAFVAGFPGHAILVADYSQIDLRVLAHMSGDPGLRDAFERGSDIHAATAAKIFGFDEAEVPRDLRERAKAINFGLAYGMGEWGLAQRLGVTPDEGRAFMEGYFANFPRVREFMDSVVAQAYRDGFTSTILGRRRYLPELEHANPRVRSMGERMALNAPIQGSSADLLKLAMIRVESDLATEKLGARMVLNVHDELVFEVPESQVSRTIVLVTSAMENAYRLSVPLRVDAAIGPNWADAKG